MILANPGTLLATLAMAACVAALLLIQWPPPPGPDDGRRSRPPSGRNAPASSPAPRRRT